MSEPARRTATYQDVLDAPEHMSAEILNGELHLSPRPGYAHQAVTSEMGVDLGSRFGRGGGDRPGGWVILDEPELHLGRPEPTSLVMVPDLAGWRRDRFVPPADHGHTLVPDWVCEVLSPGPASVRRDRIVKPDLYHRVGVTWLWVVDPAARTVEAFRCEEAGYLRVAAHTGSEEARIPPFDAVALALDAWWPAGAGE